MTEFQELINKIIAFRDARDWEQFHNSKDLAIAINLEASELLELFLWKGNEDISKDKLKEELADVFMYAILLAEKHKIDIKEIITAKIELNNKKYPVEKSKGSSKKYNEL
ncbi:MAG: nucleotide pyrophosphohydrolase [Pedobacter sp.]|nr:MAG: nucleotide pyrophosphohydrolase [Pedobacter sp.]